MCWGGGGGVSRGGKGTHQVMRDEDRVKRNVCVAGGWGGEQGGQGYTSGHEKQEQ